LPVADFNAPPVCDGSPVIFTNQSSIASGTIEEYAWDFGDETNSGAKNPTKEFLNHGTYRVKLTVASDRGCQHIAEKDVVVYPPPVANFNVSDACTKESVHLNNTSTIAHGSLTFYWDFGDNTSAVATSPSHDYQNYGVYTIRLTATAGTGCKDSVDRTVAVFSLPQISAGEDQTVSQGYPVQLNARGAVTYRWEPIEGLSNSSIPDPVAIPIVTTAYVVFGKDSYGCENSDTVNVIVNTEFKLVASNVLTPDGNGRNDTWVVENVETFGDVFVRVYDRWGKLVFEQEAYQNDWKGLSGKDILPDGTYYYYITFSSSDKVYKGALTIIRNTQ
jgi:gliding motility-associated-like protein